MTKVSFLQEKSAFHIKFPEQSDLAFYKWFTQQYPDDAIGWYHLGQEWRSRGELDQAIAAHRRAMQIKSDPYAEASREAYQDLLRQRNKEAWQKRLRLFAAAVLFFYAQFAFSPGPLTDFLPSTAPASVGGRQGTDAHQLHVEVIAVPSAMDASRLHDQVKRYLDARRPSLTQPFTVMLVPEVAGMPLFAPLPFYRPQQVRGLLRYNPVTRTVMDETWFDGPNSSREPAQLAAQEALAKEQEVLQHIAILRNAVYRHYQRNGKLPASLADLTGAYPGNSLPQIPSPPASLGLETYPYLPGNFQPDQAWSSMREVLPLPGYPEPVQPLEPLQLHLYEASRTLELRSGQHLIRRYPIGLGRNGSTPDGYHTILQKVSKPRGHDNIYGTRGMVFQADGYAIHGTNDPDSIGKYSSLGCVRLHNEAVEELYSFVSLGTEVVVSPSSALRPAWSNPAPFVMAAGTEEETPLVVYKWLN